MSSAELLLHNILNKRPIKLFRNDQKLNVYIFTDNMRIVLGETETPSFYHNF